jgi:molecular chaperone GrpE
MSDPNTSPDPNAPQQTAPGAAPADSPEAASGEPGAEQLKAIIAALQADLEAKSKEVLQLVADMDNLRKRTEREKQETAKFAITRFAVDIIGVADNFERAMQAVPAGAAEADPALASLVEGVNMIDGQLKSVLEKHGVQRIWPEGEILNPHLHQAVMQQDRPDVASGTILQVFQAGYVIDERVIRAAAVVVARGGPKAGKADAANGPASDTAGPEDPSNSE